LINTYLGYQTIARDLAKSIDRIEKQPIVQRETEYYRENIEKMKNIKQFVADDRLFRYAMKAHGLEDMAYAKAFIVKVLEEGIDNRDSFANTLTDKRYRDFAETFNFFRYGEATTVFDRTRQGTIDRYMRQTLEEDAGSQNEGVRLALYFERNAGKIDSAYSILADPAMAQVVRTALGLPQSLAAADIDRQAALIESRIDIEDFKDPAKIGEFLKRFTALWEVANPTFNPQASAGLLFGSPVESGMTTDLLLTLQRIRP
jgi:hypothetical protein